MTRLLRILVPLSALLLASACETIPTTELQAYLDASAEVRSVSNDVLDIVAPYEREVQRAAFFTDEASTAGSRPIRTSAGSQDPRLTLDALTAKPQPRSSIRAGTGSSDPRLTLDALTAKPNTPAKRQTASKPKTPKASGAATTTGLFARAVPEKCIGRTGRGGYCYELRSAHATIGDPPLVGAYRRMLDVIGRYNAILAAYARGVSGEILQSDLVRLQASLNSGIALASTPVSAGVAALPGVAAINGAFAALSPLTQALGTANDRAAFGQFLLDNYELVDRALLQMAVSSTELHSTVYDGTNNFAAQAARSNPDTGEMAREVLQARRDGIRVVIADWTVLLDGTRDLLRELRTAVANQDSLEFRLRELNVITVRTLSDVRSVRNQIKALGQPVI